MEAAGLLVRVTEADLFGALRNSAVDVLEVLADPGGLGNIAYDGIRQQRAGEGEQAVTAMLSTIEDGDPRVGLRLRRGCGHLG